MFIRKMPPELSTREGEAEANGVARPDDTCCAVGNPAAKSPTDVRRFTRSGSKERRAASPGSVRATVRCDEREAATFAAGCASFSSATDSPPASEGSASDGAAASISLRDDRTSATASPERVCTDPSAATIAAGRLSAKACRTFAASGAGASESAVGASFRNGSSSYKS